MFLAQGRRRKNPLAISGLVFLLGAVSFFLSACSEPEGDPALRRTIQFVRYLSAPNQLKRSSFLVVYPEGKPTDFVSWMFSAFGTAEWPPSEEMAEMDPMLAEQAKSIRAPMLPKGVALLPLKRDFEKGKQVVVRADDMAGILIVEAYTDPRSLPQLSRQWPLKLPK